MTAEQRPQGSRWVRRLSTRSSLVAISSAATVLFTSVIAVGPAGCNDKAICPAHQRMMDGTSCNGTDLQCEYQNPVYNCDGTVNTLASSCSCTGGKWSCPAPVEPICSTATTTTGTGTTGDGGSVMYATTADAGSTPTRAAGALRPSSCPLIFAWDGSKFFYETEVGGLTINLPPGATANQAIPVPLGGTFYHLLPHAKHDPEKGIEIRLRETVGEITYFDEAKLILVDHPEGSEVWSSGDESTNEWGYVKPFTIYSGTAPRLPISATDRVGTNVLQQLSKADNWPAPVIVGSFDNEYVLDFKEITAPEHAKLIVEGWSSYLYRAPKDVQPMIEAEVADGSWVEVTKFGAPYGDFKAVVVDLAGKLPAGAHRLRLTLGMEAGARWVIDRVRLDESAPVDIKLTTLEASTADLISRGRATLNRPSLLTRQDALDDESDPEEIQLSYGAFTRYGDVRELLTDLDSKWVIMRHGDQLSLSFPGAAPPPAGYVRTVVLKVDSVMKTFFYDNNVEPLPFHGMTSYPYPATESYPSDAEHRKYRDDYNTRIFTH